MDSINDVAGIISEEEEDRISKLPDDIIHHILGFLDMKYAVQTSKLSRKWKHIWTSISSLNFDRYTFCGMDDFAKFVKHALYHRDSSAQVSAVNLTFPGTSCLKVVQDIVKYAYDNNTTQITMKFRGSISKLPQWFFSSRTLKYLSLNAQSGFNNGSRIRNSVWDLPALETLYIGNIQLGDGSVSDKNVNLFSKCVNLKDLTLHQCSMYGLESFTIYAPRLSNLTITNFISFPMVFNLVAPQLETLSASVITASGTMSSRFNFLRLSTEGFTSLKKVNLSSSNGRYYKEKLVPSLLDLFHVVRSAKYLTLDMEIIECLESCMDQLSNEPCPFEDLKCLKINTTCLQQNDPMATVPAQVRNYLLENSPTATFVMDLTQAYIKAMTDENTTLKEKTQSQKQLIASLKKKLRMKDKVIANQNADLQMKHQIIAKQNAEIQALKFNNIRMQSNGPAPFPLPSLSSSNVPQKRSREQAPDDTIPKKVARSEAEKNPPVTMAEENKMLQENIQIRDQLIDTLESQLQKKDNFIAKHNANMKMKDKIIAKKNAEIEMLKSSNVQQSSVRGPPMPRPFSSTFRHEISREQVPTDTMPKKNSMLEELIRTQYQVIADMTKELQMKDLFIANQNENIQMKDQVIANQNANIQMKDQVIANQNANIQMLQSSNVHRQSDLHAPPPVPRPATLNVATSSRHMWT